MLVRLYSDPNQFGNVEAIDRTYATAKNAEKAVAEAIANWWHDARCTVIVTQNAAGRFVPTCIFQGADATQACIDTARLGFPSFA